MSLNSILWTFWSSLVLCMIYILKYSEVQFVVECMIYPEIIPCALKKNVLLLDRTLLLLLDSVFYVSLLDLIHLLCCLNPLFAYFCLIALFIIGRDVLKYHIIVYFSLQFCQFLLHIFWWSPIGLFCLILLNPTPAVILLVFSRTILL